MRIAQGILIGWATAIPMFMYLDLGPMRDREVRAYEAYRTCIERSDCRMTSQDWIDYYNIEWRLEK